MVLQSVITGPQIFLSSVASPACSSRLDSCLQNFKEIALKLKSKASISCQTFCWKTASFFPQYLTCTLLLLNIALIDLAMTANNHFFCTLDPKSVTQKTRRKGRTLKSPPYLLKHLTGTKRCRRKIKLRFPMEATGWESTFSPWVIPFLTHICLPPVLYRTRNTLVHSQETSLLHNCDRSSLMKAACFVAVLWACRRQPCITLCLVSYISSSRHSSTHRIILPHLILPELALKSLQVDTVKADFIT